MVAIERILKDKIIELYTISKLDGVVNVKEKDVKEVREWLDQLPKIIEALI